MSTLAQILFAVWCGLMTAFLALAAKAAAFTLAHLSSASPMGLDAGWFNAPLADAALFGSLGVAVCCVTYRWRHAVTSRALFFFFFFLGFLSLLFLVPGLSPYSSVLLAGGLGVQAARLAAAQTARFTRLCSVTVPWLLFVALAVSSAETGARWISDWQARAQAPTARADAPNVLLIVLDTVRARSLSVYGHPKPTSPWLERFAKESVLFEHALSTAPWTLPTHGTLFTGRMPTELSTDWDASLDGSFPTLAEVFSARGYLTAGFVANYDGAGARTGLNRGFHLYDDQTWSKAITGHNYPGKTRTSSSFGRLSPTRVRLILDSLANKNAAQINLDFLNWLARRQDKPVFAFLNYFDAHTPYRCPTFYDAKFNTGDPRQRRLDRYESCTAYIDDQLRRLFEELGSRGFLKNTLVVITADHGEEFGEHGLLGHGHSLYRELLEVPLMIAFSDIVPSGKRIPQSVSLADVAPTILDLAGIEMTPGMSGRSLARYWSGDGEQASDEAIMSHVTMAIRQPGWPNSDGPMASVVQNGLHYIKNFGREQEELYDFVDDPDETINLIDSHIGREWLPHFRLRIGPAAIAGTLREVSR